VLVASVLAFALIGWGELAWVRSVIALVLVVAVVSTLEASRRSDTFVKSEGGR
jgi:hypothetical protein